MDIAFWDVMGVGNVMRLREELREERKARADSAFLTPTLASL
jgi:hypothetical protein